MRQRSAHPQFQFLLGVQLQHGHREPLLVHKSGDLVLQNLQAQHGFVQRYVLFKPHAPENLKTPSDLFVFLCREEIPQVLDDSLAPFANLGIGSCREIRHIRMVTDGGDQPRRNLLPVGLDQVGKSQRKHDTSLAPVGPPHPAACVKSPGALLSLSQNIHRVLILKI